jgi:hypothetical protein
MEGCGRGILRVTIGAFVLTLTYRFLTLFPYRGSTLGLPKLERTLKLSTVIFNKQHIEGYTEPHYTKANYKVKLQDPLFRSTRQKPSYGVVITCDWREAEAIVMI